MGHAIALTDVCEFYPRDAAPWDIGRVVEEMWEAGYDLWKEFVMSITPHKCEATRLMTKLYRYTLLFRRRRTNH